MFGKLRGKGSVSLRQRIKLHYIFVILPLVTRHTSPGTDKCTCASDKTSDSKHQSASHISTSSHVDICLINAIDAFFIAGCM